MRQLGLSSRVSLPEGRNPIDSIIVGTTVASGIHVLGRIGVFTIYAVVSFTGMSFT